MNTLDTKKKILAALAKSSGNVSEACKAVGISRGTFYLWREEDEAFKTDISEITEASIDVVEGELMKKIKSGDTACIIFFLKTRGKTRGYVERNEITGKDGAPLAATVYRLPDGQDIEL